MAEYRLKNLGVAVGMESVMTKVLTDSQLKRLSEHKYSSGGVSILEPFLQPYWRWLVEQIPVWVAPNLLTIAGLVLNVVTTLILVYYSPDAKSEVSTFDISGQRSRMDGRSFDDRKVVRRRDI